MSQQQTPRTNPEARVLGLDLDGDNVVDNQLGLVMATLAGQGLDTQGLLTSKIDRGEMIQLISLGVEDLTFASGKGTFTLFTGDDPVPAPCANAGDTVCRKHLAGTGAFTIAATSAQDTPIAGDINASQLLTPVTTGGNFQLVTLFFTEIPIALDLIGARVRVPLAVDGVTDGVIAGAVTDSDLQTKVLPQMHAGIVAAVNRDCGGTQPPNCGCTNGTSGDTFISLFDTDPQNCSVSLAEVRDNGLIASLLAPDVSINGQDALSVGVGFDAVLASFAP
jgi:hypothetical protein